MKILTTHSIWRIVLLLAVGAAVGLWLIGQSARRLPPRVPDATQQKGIERLNDILARIAATPFGRSARGQELRTELETLIASGQLLFVTNLGAEGKYMEVPFGTDVLCIDVFRFGRDDATECVLPNDDQIARAAFHEAVHSLRTDGHCIDEECDGMVAAFQADAALTGKTLPTPVLADDQPIAQYVTEHYTDLERDAGYRPVGLSREEFDRLAGF